VSPLRRFRLVALLFPSVLHPQELHTRGQAANIKVHSDLVLMNVLVTDRQGRVVTGLDASNFRLTENGKEQTVRYCASDDVPVSIGLILDTSGSMAGKLAILKQSVVDFVRAGNEGDEYFLVEFRDRPRTVVPFTDHAEQITEAIRGLNAADETALLDALPVAVREMRQAHHSRKAMLLVSDGVDNHSRYTDREAKRLISELGVPVYTINLYERPGGNRYALQQPNPVILETISTLTGGRTFHELNAKRVSAVAELIASEIRHEYVLGYVPSDLQRNGKFNHVRIQLEPLAGREFRISHRQGYYAPTE
jgi:Ca-activated chloride channel family protein